MSLRIPSATPEGVSLLSLGAMVHRISSGTTPLSHARDVKIHVSGGEFNVACNLCTTFKHRTAVATATVPNYGIGRLVLNSIPNGMTVEAKEFQHDGVRGPNIAAVFSDCGVGMRGPVVEYNRSNEAAALLRSGDFDWKEILNRLRPRIVHSGGIFAAIGEHTPDLILELFQEAGKIGIVRSLDLNFRAKLWNAHPSLASGRETLRRIAQEVDVLFGNEEDLQLGLGIRGPDVQKSGELDSSVFKGMIEDLSATFPGIKVVSTTLRDVHSANRHDWGSILWMNGDFFEAPTTSLDVVDRIGGGDGAASALIHCLLEGSTPDWAQQRGWSFGQYCVNMAWSLGALLTTTYGDTSMVTADDVIGFARGKGARVAR